MSVYKYNLATAQIGRKKDLIRSLVKEIFELSSLTGEEIKKLGKSGEIQCVSLNKKYADLIADLGKFIDKAYSSCYSKNVVLGD